jgi:hypothetical protein
VIVITGSGRSGTSVLSLLYKELGFDPGGNWIPEARAGLEHGDFWKFNNKLAAEIGATMLHPPKRLRDKPAAPAKSRVRLARWDRLDAVVETHGARMVELAKKTPVVKDPRFIWTLPIWLAAGAEIDHVVITVRAMEDVVASRQAAGQSEFSAVELRNSLTYGLGVATATVIAHDVSHSFIRFPDFLSDIDGLYTALRFPEPVAFDRFQAAAASVFDHDQVHDWSSAASDAGSSAGS